VSSLTCLRPPSHATPGPTRSCCSLLFSFSDTAPAAIYTPSLHDDLPISPTPTGRPAARRATSTSRCDAPSSTRWTSCRTTRVWRSEEHTSELQSRENLVCRLLLEKKNQIKLSDVRGDSTRLVKQTQPRHI